MQRLKGLATGIGSLPHQEVETALDLVFKYLPAIPFWPQLPKRDLREGMVAQFSESLPFLKIEENNLSFSVREAGERELEIFYERVIANDVDYFKISEGFALGIHRFAQRLEKEDLKQIEFIKCQITGPFTFAASIKDEKGIALLYDAVLMQAVSRGLIMKALWQIKFFQRFGKKIIIFIDEPYLACFGSAYTPLNREDVISGLTEFAQGIKSEDVLVGVHCCGNTDWSIFTEIKNIDIISFDAFGYLDEFLLYAENLKGFIKRDGIICWGVVPTQEYSGKETVDLLTEKIKYGVNILEKKGLDRKLLVENLLLSPSCGLGSLDVVKADKIFNLLLETSNLIRNSF
jgi:methionine synthase II (cobalamin-independent)